MSLVRSLRIRIAVFASVTVLAALLCLNVAVTSFISRSGDARVTQRLHAAGTTLLTFVRAEHREHPAEGWPAAVGNALDEWPTGADAYAVRAADGALIGARGNPDLVRHADNGGALRMPEAKDIDGARVLLIRDTITPALTVVAIGSLDAERQEAAALARWLLLSTPVLTVASLGLGYLLARRALQPVDALATSITALDVERLDARLLAPEGSSEITELSDRFNALLERLARSRQRTRRFVREAAHQIRTPLTLVLGEAGLQRLAPHASPDVRQAFERVLRAAQQMQRRVDDLVLLAIADAGEQPPCADPVELDAVALDVTDLLRSRAMALGHQLALGTIDPVIVQGDEALLRELLLELLENACRHGTTLTPIRVAVSAQAGQAHLTVRSAGAPFALPHEQPDAFDETSHLGLPLVQWITRLHRGTITVTHIDGDNMLTLTLPHAC